MASIGQNCHRPDSTSCNQRGNHSQQAQLGPQPDMQTFRQNSCHIPLSYNARPPLRTDGSPPPPPKSNDLQTQSGSDTLCCRRTPKPTLHLTTILECLSTIELRKRPTKSIKFYQMTVVATSNGSFRIREPTKYKKEDWVSLSFFHA